MPFAKIMIHIVFGTKSREPLLSKEILEKTITHIKENAKQKEIFLDCINGYTEHLHCLISLGTEQSVSKVVNLIKGESSYWLNKNHITSTKFEWADEYYAASVSVSQLDVIRKYINAQKEHHRKKSYTEECEEFLKKYGFRSLG
jgi:putative transposase